MSVSSEPLSPNGTAATGQTAAEDANMSAGGKLKREILDIILFTLYGIFNNGLICVVYGAAQDIVNVFGYQDQTTLPTLVSTCASIAGPFLLLLWPLNKMGYRARTVVAVLFGLAGFLLLALSTSVMTPAPGEKAAGGFVLAIVAVFFSGLQQSFGENCACMRFRRFSNKALSCWGAGTGLAGIFPPMLYGAISHLPLSTRFLVMLPLLAVYMGICLIVYEIGRNLAPPHPDVEAVAANGDEARAAASTDGQPDPNQAHLAGPTAALDTEGRSRTTADGDEQPTNCFAWYVISIFSAVYGLEYFIYPTLVDRSTKCKPTSPLGDQAYNTSWIAYNIGVTISRGSIAFFEFPCIWLVALLQAINLTGWAVEVGTHFLPAMGGTGYIIQYAWMVWVGLMGGTAYANCIAKFNRSPRIPDAKRDKLVNLAFAISMMTIMASTIIGELLDNTILTVDIVNRTCPTPYNTTDFSFAM